METPTPFPTFKVRREKMGDRITALQQLVSPFGKRDTASVLHEAIEYIKFLHDQVNVLSTPYNGAPVPRLQNYDKSKKKEAKQDLKSRGLCLVPISSTFPVADENTTDFWIPTFGGTFRDYTMTLQYSSNSSNSLPSNDVKLCHCKRRMNVTTSWNAENPGRRFLSCPEYTFGQKCDYFKWIDPPMCARSKQIIPGLLNKCNDMEREMKMLKFKMKCVMMALSWCFCFLLMAWAVSHVVV